MCCWFSCGGRGAAPFPHHDASTSNNSNTTPAKPNPKPKRQSKTKVNCARFGREPDLPLLRFKERLAGPDGTYQPDPTGALRLAAYQEICERVVSEIL